MIGALPRADIVFCSCHLWNRQNVGKEVELKISEEGKTEDMWIKGNKMQLFSISTYSTVEKLDVLTGNKKTSRI